MATIELYRTGKRTNSTLRPKFVAGDSYESSTCQFFEPLNILNPTIILREEAMANLPYDLCKYNYVYIQSPLDRYYWITKWTRQDGLWYAECTVDYLASWRNTILESEQYITRSSIKWNDSIPDNGIYGYKITPYSSESAAFSMISSGYTYRTPEGGSGFGGHRLYAWINSCFLSYNTAAGGNLYKSTDSYLIYNFDTSYYPKILGKLKNNVDTQKVNLANFINRLYYLPIEAQRNIDVYDDVFPDAEKGTYPNLLYYGYQHDAAMVASIEKENVGVTFDYIGTPKATDRINEIREVRENKYVDLIWTADIPGKSSIAWENGSSRTKINIIFQPFGCIQVDPNILIGQTKCQLLQRIYLATGDSILYIDTGLGQGQQIATSNVAQEIPISTIVNNGEAYRRQGIQNGFDVATSIGRMTSAAFAGASTGGMAFGTPGAAIGAITGFGISVIQSLNMGWRADDRVPIQTNGSISGISSSILSQTPTISVLRYETTDRDDARFGRPLCEKRVLGSQLTGATAANNYKISNPGLVVCQGAQIKSGTGIEIGATMLSTERDAIESAMNGGIYLE